MKSNAMEFWKNKKVFITGHTGFKGSWLTTMLVESGAKITGYSIDIPTTPSIYEKLSLSKKIESDLRGDILNFSQLKQAIDKAQPEIIFHLAAQPLVRASYDNPVLTYATNLMGTVNILECTRLNPAIKAALIVTTDKCYRNTDEGRSFVESDPLGGKDPYSASKACAEIATESYIQSYFSNSETAAISSVRAGNVIGGGDWAADRIIPDCINAWNAKKPLSLRNPAHTRPWQHVLEPLWGYLQTAENLLKKTNKIAGQSFNFGPNPSGQQDVHTLIQECKKNLPGLEIEIAVQPDKRVEAKTLSLDIHKAEKYLNWSPKLSFEETVKMTTEWYKKTGQNPEATYEFTVQQINSYLSEAKA